MKIFFYDFHGHIKIYIGILLCPQKSSGRAWAHPARSVRTPMNM